MFPMHYFLCDLFSMDAKSFFFSSGKNPKRAIAYYRHSAEDKQENSVPIQRELTEKFAQEHGVEIIHEEFDEGETGLLADRPGFTNLFKDWVLKKDAPAFDYVFVYDVSRWGRFQDQDEAAYYEFRCKQQGKKVVYVSKGFPKAEQQLIAHLQTSIERYMAAEYSRQLSGKVFNGCVKVSEQGYSAGGVPCYGMARELLDVHKQPIRLLKKGEHKQIANERVRFVPLNDETTNVVRDIFSMFVTENLALSQIVSVLNDRGIPSACGGLWNRDKIVRILMNETYTGARLYNKTWNRLRQGKRVNPRQDWIITRNTFPAIIEHDVFLKAQEKLWMALGKWKTGKKALKEAKMRIFKEMKNLLIAKGIHEDQVFSLCQHFPFLFSITTVSSPSKKEWTFLLSEEFRTCDYVFGIAIVSSEKNLLDQFFLLPVKDFGGGGVCSFSEKDERYHRYSLPLENMEERILGMLQRDLVQSSEKLQSAFIIAAAENGRC